MNDMNEVYDNFMRMFDLISDDSELMFYLYDYKSRRARCNKRLSKIFQIPEKIEELPSIVGKIGAMTEESKVLFSEMLQKIEGDCFTASCVVKVNQENGSIEVYETKLQAMTDESGAKTGLCVGSYHDVTRRYVKDLSAKRYLKMIEADRCIRFTYDKKKDCMKYFFKRELGSAPEEKSTFFYSRMVREEKIVLKSDIPIVLDFLTHGTNRTIQVNMFDMTTEEYRLYAVTGTYSKDNPNLLEGKAEDITDLRDDIESQKRMDKVLDCLAQDFLLIMEIDLKRNKYEVLLNDTERLDLKIAETGVYTVINENIVSRVAVEHQKMRLDFGNIETIAKQLKNKRRLVCEYRTKMDTLRWRKAVITASEYDENGEPSKALLSHVYVDDDEIENQFLAEQMEIPSEIENGCVVLLVEDYALNAKFETEVLQAAGLKVDWVKSGKEAMDHLNIKSPGTYRLILLDTRLKDQSGYELAGRIRTMKREDLREIPIFAMDLDDHSEVQEQVKSAGMDELIQKPILMEQLSFLLERYQII